MTAQTAAREICSFIELCLEVSTGEASQEEIAKHVQQAIDEAVKEERERYEVLLEAGRIFMRPDLSRGEVIGPHWNYCGMLETPKKPCSCDSRKFLAALTGGSP